MNQMTWCSCSNYNCPQGEGEGWAEPYDSCIYCGYPLEPISEDYNIHPEQEGFDYE